MGNYELLKAAINEVIKANGRQEITGEVLNQVLLSMVNSLGAGYQCMGVATPSTNPGTPDQNVFYFATQAGTYTNFDAIVLQAGISVLIWDGDWASQTWFTIDATPTNNSQNLIASGAVFNALKLDGGAYDVTAHNSGATFASLSALLNSANLNTLIPTEIRHGGMSIKYVQSSDNKYISYMLVKNTWSADLIDWEKINLKEELTQLSQKVGEEPNAVVMFNKLVGLKWDGTSVSASNSTFNAVIIPLDDSPIKFVEPVNSTEGLASVTFYEETPVIGSTPTRVLSSVQDIIPSPNEKYMMVTLFVSTINSVTIKYTIGTGITKKVEILNADFEKLAVATNSGMTGNPIGTYKLCGLRVSGDSVSNTVLSAYSGYDGVIVEVPKTVSQICVPKINNFISYAHSYDSIPTAGTTGGEYIEFEEKNDLLIYTFTPKNTTRYILFTINTAVANVGDFLVYPYPFAQDLVYSTLIKQVRRVTQYSKEVVSMTDVGYIQEDGTIAKDSKWKNGYISLSGVNTVLISHIAYNTEYTSTYFYFCDENKDPIVGYQLSLGQKKIIVPEGASYLFLAVQFYNSKNNDFYCNFYSNDIEMQVAELDEGIESLNSDIEIINRNIEGLNQNITLSEFCNLIWNGTSVASSDSRWNGVLLQLSAGLTYRILTQYGALVGFASAYSFDHLPIDGDTTYIKGYLNNDEFTPGENEKYLLISIYLRATTSVSLTAKYTGIKQQLNNVASLNSLVFGDNLNRQRRNALSSTIQKLRLDTLSYTILGDSITDTWDGRGGAGGGASDAAHGYPQIVHRWLKEKYGNNIQFTNNGKGGDTTANALSAFDTVITPYNYDLVGLALGTNDWNVQTSLTTFESTYRQLIAKVTDDTNAEYFIIGIGYFGTWGPTKTIREDKYNNVLRKLAKEFGVPYVDVYNAMKSDVDMGNDTLSDITYTPDPVHPNDSGHLIWAAETFKIFD